MRTTPPHLQQAALAEFDNEVQAAFCQATGLLPDSIQWEQATRGFARAGLGLRSTVRHSSAAYLASVGASQAVSEQIFPEYIIDTVFNDSAPSIALDMFNVMLPDGKRMSSDAAFGASQKALSDIFDEVAHDVRLATAETVDQATLLSECQPGARAFFEAMPNKNLGLAVPPAEFVSELRTRLCMRERAADAWCPLRDGILDSRGHHSRMCCAGGDRTLRHNALRNYIFRVAMSAGLRPELERPGLLIPQMPDETGTERRRPADVYLPAWSAGSPAALDFAVTAPQRQEIVMQAARTGLAAAKAYSEHKKAHLNTQGLCSEAGIDFIPMVAETSGAWAPSAMNVLKQMAASVATCSGRKPEIVMQQILQNAAIRIRRANARATLRRAADSPEESEAVCQQSAARDVLDAPCD